MVRRIQMFKKLLLLGVAVGTGYFAWEQFVAEEAMETVVEETIESSLES